MTLCSLPFEEYVALDAVNWSALKEMRNSPLHYAHRRANPREDTLSLAMGRATHTAILEPDLFPEQYAVYSGGDRRGKAWDAFKAAHEDRTILKLEEYRACLRMRDAVRSHPVSAPLFSTGAAEQSLTWIDPATEIACKARLDWVRPILSGARWQIVDLKTTTTVDGNRFGSVAGRLGYHCQMAHYAKGLEVVTGLPVDVLIVAVEVAEPHDVAVFEVDEDALYAGAEEVGELLERLRLCRATGHYPGRYIERQTLRLPSWIFPDDDDGELVGHVADPAWVAG